MGGVSGIVETTSRFCRDDLGPTRFERPQASSAAGVKLPQPYLCSSMRLWLLRAAKRWPLVLVRLARDAWHQSRRNGLRFKRFVIRFDAPFWHHESPSLDSLSRILFSRCPVHVPRLACPSQVGGIRTAPSHGDPDWRPPCPPPRGSLKSKGLSLHCGAKPTPASQLFGPAALKAMRQVRSRPKYDR